MTIEKMFEVATRTKMRFSFRGLISTEDLWDLSVESLDLIFKNLSSELNKAQEESLLNTKTKEDKELDVKIEIVKHIVKIKLEEASAKLKSKEKKDQQQKLLKILSSKQDESLQNKSIEELKAMLEELNS